MTVDQGAIKGSRRSNPATYTGLLDPIRKAFAKANGVKPALFSANSEGACPNCNGAGVIYTDLGDHGRRRDPCEECGASASMRRCSSTRSAARTSARSWPCRCPRRRGSSATARRAPRGAQDPGAARRRRPWIPQLGQPLTTLSGGERQRLKLATHLGEKGGVYILDEPTSGLHLADVEQLLGLLDRLVDSGKSVIVVEHHQAMMAHADWIIDLGPGAGHDGGRVIFEGTPADLVAARATLTGEHLAEYVGPEAARAGIIGRVSTPAEVKARLDAERRGEPFLLYRDGGGAQVIVTLTGPSRSAAAPSATSPSRWDTEVSRLHAQLEPVGSDWIVVDDGLSRNGTYVNGERVNGRRRLTTATGSCSARRR